MRNIVLTLFIVFFSLTAVASRQAPLITMTTAERSTFTSVKAGQIIYNTTTSEFELYTGTQWVPATVTNTGPLNMMGNQINNLGTPTSPSDAATKSYVDAHSTVPGGANTQIQFNNSGAFGGSASLSWNGSALSVPNINNNGTPGNGTIGGETNYFAEMDTQYFETQQVGFQKALDFGNPNPWGNFNVDGGINPSGVKGDFNISTSWAAGDNGHNVNGLFFETNSAYANSQTTQSIELRPGECTGSTNCSTGNIVFNFPASTGTGTRGKFRLQDGSEGTSGWVWTSTDTVGSGHWAAPPATGANTTLSNLTNPVAVNQNLQPDTDQDWGLGTASIAWSDLFAMNNWTTYLAMYPDHPHSAHLGGDMYSQALVVGHPEVGGDLSIQSYDNGQGLTYGLNLQSSPQNGASTNSKPVILRSGDATGLTSNSGDVYLLIGSATGTKGKIKFQDGSEGTSGWVWTSTDTVGSGHWAAPSGGLPAPLESLASFTNEFSGSPGTFIGNNSDNDQTNLNIFIGSTDTASNTNSASTVNITGGSLTGASSTGNAGAVIINGGDVVTGTGAGGQVALAGGGSVSGAGGNVVLQAGDASSGSGGVVGIVSGQSGTGTPGDIGITGAAATGGTHNGASVNISTGTSAGGDSGNVNVSTANQTTSGNTGGLFYSTGNATSGNSGNISLQSGTASGTRGKIQFKDGSEGVSGYVWTSTDTVGSGHWAAVGTSANQTLSNLTSPTAVNQHLMPGTNTTYNLGGTSKFWNNFYIGGAEAILGSLQFWDSGLNQYSIIQRQSVVLPDGSSFSGLSVEGNASQTTSRDASLFTDSDGGGGAVATGNLFLETGNKSGGTANSGSITLYTGTATGTRGKIQFKDGSEGTSGYVWTSTDTVGSGHWALASSGANTALSNLTTTSINQSLVPSTDNSFSLGSAVTRWNTYYARTAFTVYDGANSGGRITVGLTTPSGAVTDAIAFRNDGDTPVAVFTQNDSGNPTGGLAIETGNSTSSATGSITVSTGTTSGTRGKIIFQDGSQGTAGYVWTSTNTSGSGKWDTFYHFSNVTSSPVTIASTDQFDVYLVDTTSARTINLPAASSVANRLYRFKDKTGSAGTNNISLVPNGTDTIDGLNSTFLIQADYGTAVLFSDGTSWWVM